MTQHDPKRKAASYPSVVTVSVLVLAGAVAGCGGEEQVFDAPSLELLVKPTSIKDRGEETDIQVLARDEFDRPGKGDVVLEAEHGRFSNEERTITVQLDSSGTGWAAYHCDINEDEECFGPVTVTASWKSATSAASVEPATASRDLTILGCGRPNPGNPSIVRRCAPAAASECSGEADSFLSGAGVPASRLNGASGNGFDDDCDGLVDEGCSCPGNGQTKQCFLLPATQVNVDTGLPVNWCATNSKGSVDCVGEQQTVWSGVCRGAQPPAENDSCSEGDFNCDGLQSNNALFGCRCAGEVKCPTDPIVKAPFPDPRNLAPLDGTQWIIDPAKRALATNWTWTVVGGDCDNVLPFPTFGLFRSKDTTVSSSRIGTKKQVAFDASQSRYVEQAQSPLASLRATISGGTSGVVYPAFGLSGDYLVQGEFDLGGAHYVCTQKVQVRAPGLRAELCWDSVGGDDLDLHFARLQDVACSLNGWDRTCFNQDCYWENKSPNWSYTSSATSVCHGWSSKRLAPTCTNPRLDTDNVSCNRTTTDPNAASFCGPENINIDNPKNGDRFVVGVNYFGSSVTTNPRSHPHVNIYCNGERVLSAGYNPVTGQVNFPVLLKPGLDASGDYWTVATVQTTVDATGNLVSCGVETIPSRFADPTRDGPSPTGAGADFCVDSMNNATPAPNMSSYTSHRFVDDNSIHGIPSGSIPQTREQWCKH